MNDFVSERSQLFILFSADSLPSYLLAQAQGVGVAPSGQSKGRLVGSPEFAKRFSHYRCSPEGREKVDILDLFIQALVLDTTLQHCAGNGRGG